MTDPEKATDGNNEASVLELTRDLVQPETQEEPESQGSGIDWNFGKDNETPASDAEDTASMTGEEGNDSDDNGDDKTVELEAENEETTLTLPDLEESEDEAFLENIPKIETAATIETATNEDNDDEEAEASLNDANPSEAASDQVGEDSKAEQEQVSTQNQEEETASPGLRRSRRTPKKRAEQEVEPEPKKARLPSEKKLLISTDKLFVQADKDSVTVKDIVRELEKEYDCKLPKKIRKKIRGRLVSLMKEEIDPQVETDDQSPPQDDGDEPGESEPEEPQEDDVVSEQGDVESEYEADASEDEEEAPEKKKRPVKKAAKKSTTSKRKQSQPKKKRPSQRKAAKAARLVEAMRLRKKRMEELRVRSEEMQLLQSKEDQVRAEKIAQKLETNNDELKLKRLEDRLDLLGKLDRKRILVLEAAETKSEKNEQDPSTPMKQLEDKESDEEEESDEEDLVIVGATKRSFKPLAPLPNHAKASALDVLRKIKSPDRKKYHQQQQQKPKLSSPSRPNSNGMGARFALRNALKKKQRTVGNLWLARELGYKTEVEHLQTCQKVVQDEFTMVKRREHNRVQANERKQLRDRLLYQPEEEEEEELEIASPAAEEEDEEVQMAKQIEEEGGEQTSAPTEDGNEKAAPPAVDLTESRFVKRGETSKDQTDEDEFGESAPVNAGEREQSAPTDVLESPAPSIDGEPQESFGSNFEASEKESAWETQPPPPAEAVVREVTTEELATSSDYDAPTEEAKETLDNGDKTPEATEETLDSSTTTTSDVATAEPKAVSPDTTSKPDNYVDDDDEEELEFETQEESTQAKSRNSAWQQMLQKEAEKLKKQKKRKGGLLDQEAEEEEEEEVAGLEDFGFSIKKKNKEEEEEDPDSFKLDEDDLEHVVDDVSDGEGDEEAGQLARKRLEQREEKLRHKDMLRRMREGFDGRRGGIGSGVGARGMHRFDQLVAADNKEDAKRLGLLNDDEISDDEENQDASKNKNGDDEEDETAMLDKILKDRFLHRSNVELENFSEDEEETAPEEVQADSSQVDSAEAEEERTQERLARRFAKRARMCRLEEQYGESQEFSQQRLIDEDESMQRELKEMKCGLVRKRSITSSRSSFSSQDSGSANPLLKRQRSTGSNSFGGSFLDRQGSLSLALRAGKTLHRTSFLGGANAGGGDHSKTKDRSLIHKSVALSHVVFRSENSQSRGSFSSKSIPSAGNKHKFNGSGSFFRKVAGKKE